MSETSPRGRFVWYDLMTTDPNAAADFYTKIAGWGTQPWENSPTPYTMWTTHVSPIGGVMKLMPEMVGSVPPHWIGYVAVPNVDDSAKQAEALGGKVLSAPMDIPEVGRCAVISDPQGAAIAIFTPKDAPPDHEGKPNVGEISWHELTTTDHQNGISSLRISCVGRGASRSEPRNSSMPWPVIRFHFSTARSMAC